jgi:soluble lytic murein transglycosylase
MKHNKPRLFHHYIKSSPNLYGVGAKCKVLSALIVMIMVAVPCFANDAQIVKMIKAAEKGQAVSPQDQFSKDLVLWVQVQNGKALKGANKDQNFKAITELVKRHPNWPSISSMKSAIERNMPDTASPRFIVSWYDTYHPKSAKAAIDYLRALSSLDQTSKARSFLRKWWEDTPTSRADQQMIYQNFGGFLKRENHIRRLDTVLFAKQYQNATALAGILGSGHPDLVKARIALAKNQANANTLIQAVPKQYQNDAGLMYERLKWRRKKDLDLRAIEILNSPPPANRVKNKKEWWRERHIIIRRLLEKKQYKAAYLLARGHIQSEGFPFAQAEWISGWIALEFLNKPREAFNHFEKLYNGVKSPISKSRGAYWGGRAARAIGREDIALPWLNAAAVYQTTFYGQMAATALSRGGSIPTTPVPTLTLSEQAALEKTPFVRAARLMHKAGMTKYTERFISAYAKTLETPKEFRYAADIAIEMGHHNQAIRIAKDASTKGLFLSAQAYPIITDRLERVKSKIRVEWPLIHGLIRQESAFDFDARSRVGASGLMQLMPATAREVARKNGVSHQQDWLATRPNHNITLGSLYLAQMLDRYDGYYPMAIAAYNAGPGRVDRWIKEIGDPRRSGGISMANWIELIPIYETRNYVQRVMEATQIYRLRLAGQIPPLPQGFLHSASR